MKQEVGTIYQKPSGTYYYRYQIDGERKAISLKTKNQDEAKRKVKELLPVLKATSMEVVSAHVAHARNLIKPANILPLSEVWSTYSKHPNRATPATVNERLNYEADLRTFLESLPESCRYLHEVTPELADVYAQKLRKEQLAVDTHNRKLKRLRKIFSTLADYCPDGNPFDSPALWRKDREEQEHNTRRLAFTREQEQALLDVLADSTHKVMNKPEIRVIYHLGMFTGQRLKDCVLLQWHKVDLGRRRIWVTQFKTGKEVTIPIADQLLAVLLEAQAWKRDEYVCPNCAARYKKVDATGKNVGSNQVGLDVLRVIRWIGLEPSVEVPGRKKKTTVYGFHSLRHSFASHCAEAGVPKAVLLSILGTDSDIADKYYTHIGDEAQEKAIAAVANITTVKSDRQRIDEVLELLDTSEVPAEEILKRVRRILKE
ncbi:MAG: tyrosine-type recombinase/integrase [Lentisphaeria bacterium]|nr:tyrosine-type recombinase/integrase [Lentisphaeria bacterium]